jgi:hypothetical protein
LGLGGADEGGFQKSASEARGWTCFEAADSRATDRKQTKMTRPALFSNLFPDLISGFFPFLSGLLVLPGFLSSKSIYCNFFS